MVKIKQLPLHEAQKIAAGEVVERPANIVKELIENALDAGSTILTVYLEEGGRDLIRVVDNGSGMSQEDARMCFEQHATSKITCVEDLDSISTFGFRGEALASIAAVSHVTLVTREQHPEQKTLSGTEVEIKAGTILGQKIVACPPGTDITVKNLFFNLPARQKFLKKKETETRQITQLLHAFCLDHIHVHCSLIHNGREVLTCPATESLASRVAQLWDHTSAQHMITLPQTHHNGITLSGIISNHQHFRFDSSQIFLFVNKRWIKDVSLSRAVIRGYTNVLPPARYPTAALFIELDPTQVDINIHPKKEEVLFLHPRAVESAVQATIKEALEQHLSAQIHQPVTLSSARPDQSTPFTFTRAPSFQPFDFGALPEPFAPHQHFVSTPSPQPLYQPVSAPLQEQPVDTQPSLIFDNQDTLTVDPVQSHHPDEQPAQPLKLIGQLNNTYLLIERHDGLFLIDQHAAHERILYEQFSSRFHDVATVALMFPEIITLSTDDMAALADKLEIFTSNGIVVEQLRDNQLMIISTPVHLKNINLGELVRETASWIREFDTVDQTTLFSSIHEKLRAQMACKAAIKAGDVLRQEEMVQLIQDLEKTTNRLTCPHGRPTGWLLSTYEIEKRFKRKI